MFIIQLWPLRLLYLDAGIRGKIPPALQATADGRGWLLSDLTLLEVRSTDMTVMHRDHRRTGAEEQCVEISYERLYDAYLSSPCDESSL